MSPQIGVLALQGAVAEHVRALTASGAEVRTVRRPAELDGLRGLVVPGGESTAIARLAAPVQMMEHIHRAHQDGLALFGTCAGLILMAREVSDPAALAGFPRIGGLDVVARRNGYGSQLDSFTEQLDVTGLDEPLEAVFIRAPVIEEVGDGVEVLAESRGLSVAVREGRVLATSFHPELTPDHRLHQLFVDMVGAV
ncbi:pyridoxal 5'-phosphate synthase glutaminase subunit PdxT [Nesterenkonia sp. PF2B19]|uniref:pyridoxal 5'-phosphate synthase glutaminase subunit PdxT n=1 Tax=Nesterenkonia sp. PF2B19 TaxID=1881858 RepID=UPI000A19E288|nr:pyridoxal 5'-phosphate synthase glutaminase subunit PdxT [Nesterenkonia sp. PF2B19]OSM42035.1 pyridoxal 5'-phosphate synthase glutaminase subunit PdxT [Nesterenkonia sp. PF2B19]